jgi:hypothetical protein
MPAGRGRYNLVIKYVSQGPKPVRAGQPRYPQEAIRNRIEGTVALIGELHADGKLVIDDALAQVPQDGKKMMLKTTEDYFLGERYLPETVDGKPVAARFRMTVSYALSAGARDTVFISAPSHFRSDRRKTYCGNDAGEHDAASAREEKARREFFAQAAFDVGAGKDRSWADGMSSVLKPRAVDTVVMQP